MSVNKKKNLRYNVFNPNQLKDIYQSPIISDTQAPKTSDLADIGTIWIDKDSDDAYILTSVTANVASWQDISGISAGGTDGQLWIAATGAAGAWANLTSTGLSVTITNTANGINLEAAGVAALTTLDGDAGTATPAAGVIIIAGGTNITTAGAAGTLTVNLDASPSVAGSLTAGTTVVAGTSVTAGVDLVMLTGDCTITADTDAADTIYLHANGGTSETIKIHSDLGTGTDSVNILSDVGGIKLDAGLAAANSIIIDASDAAGGIDIDAGTGGINVTATNGAISLISGTGALNVGTDATAHTVTVGSTNTTAATVIQSGTGDVAVTSTDAITLDAVGVLELNSSAAAIGIGSDADAFDINIGTGAAARTITIGNATGATAVDVNCGTGDLTLGTSANAHTTTLGSTNSTCNVIIQSGTGGIQETSGGVFAIDATDAITIESSAGTIGIGVDAVAQDINVGIGAAARTITVGNATGATAIALTSGTGDIVADSQDAITLDAAGVIELNSDGAAIGIGNDADAFGINIGTGAAAREIQIGNATGATEVEITGGSAGITLTPTLGIMTAAPLETSDAAVATTASGNLISCTFTGQTTASAASQVFTITNTLVTTASAIFATASNIGANDAQMTVTRVEPKAGSVEVTLTNNGAAALNGDVIINLWVIKA